MKRCLPLLFALAGCAGDIPAPAPASQGPPKVNVLRSTFTSKRGKSYQFQVVCLEQIAYRSVKFELLVRLDSGETIKTTGGIEGDGVQDCPREETLVGTNSSGPLQTDDTLDLAITITYADGASETVGGSYVQGEDRLRDREK